MGEGASRSRNWKIITSYIMIQRAHERQGKGKKTEKRSLRLFKYTWKKKVEIHRHFSWLWASLLSKIPQELTSKINVNSDGVTGKNKTSSMSQLQTLQVGKRLQWRRHHCLTRFWISIQKVHDDPLSAHMECPQIIQVAAAGCVLNCIIHFMNYLSGMSFCFMHVRVHFIYFFVCVIQE